MPSQAEFEDAATLFARSADQLEALMHAPRRALTDHVKAALARQSVELRSLALTSRLRADECQRYRASMRLYEAALADYQEQLRRWTVERDEHAIDPRRPAPGPAPIAPNAPPPPPPWLSA
jgi:hypothetical protein